LRRTTPAATVLLASATLALLAPAAVTPASAQFFDRIFRDEPPRPPADVGGEQQQQQPVQRPPADAQRPTYQTLRPPTANRAPTEWQNPDLLPQNQRLQPGQQYPDQQYPGQQYPQGGVPPPGGVQSQPLAPPPGVPQQGQEPLRGSQDAGLPPPQGQQGVQPGQAQPGQGQPGQPGQPQPGQLPGDDAQPNDEIVVRPPEQKIENPKAVFTGLDKITGRTITFDVAINETVQFGALQVTPRVCYTRPPTEAPNTDAFVKVDEVTLQGDVKKIFSGWMFAASPGLNAVEHPVYDVWLIDCKGGGAATASAETDDKAQKADGNRTQAVPVPPRQPQRRTSAPPQQPGFMPALR
jgi:hypothetical protein